MKKKVESRRKHINASREKRESRNKKKKKGGLVGSLGRMLLLGLILFLLLSLYLSNSRLTTSYYQVASPSMPNAFNGYKIAQISDVHGSDLSQDLLEHLQEEEPNIVLVTGDMISQDQEDWAKEIEILDAIAQEFTTYYILGNHEMWMENTRQKAYLSNLENTNLIVLRNRTIPVLHQGSRIYIAGLEEDEAFYSVKASQTAMPVEHFLGPKQDEFTILFAHNPLYWQDYLNWGAELTISGHMHGGAIRIPGIGGVFSPEGNFFPEYDKGVYTEEGRSLVVSGGIGNSGIPFRLFNPPELVIIELQSQSIH